MTPDEFLKRTKGLKDSHRLFLTYYLPTLNASGSGLMAGYDDPASGREILNIPAVRAVVEVYLKERYMDAMDVQARISDVARTDMSDFLDIDEDGNATINLKKAKEFGSLKLIKKCKTTTRETKLGDTITQTEIELLNPLDAMREVAKMRGVLKDIIVLEDDAENSPMALMRKKMAEMKSAKDALKAAKVARKGVKGNPKKNRDEQPK